LAITTPSDFDYAIELYKKKEKEKKEKVKEDYIKSAEPSVAPVGQSSAFPFVKLRSLKIPLKVLTKFPQEVAVKYKMVVFEAPEDKNLIKVALVNPEDSQAKEILDFIKQRNNLEIEKYQTSEADLNWALRLYGQKISEEKKEAKPLRGYYYLASSHNYGDSWKLTLLEPFSHTWYMHEAARVFTDDSGKNVIIAWPEGLYYSTDFGQTISIVPKNLLVIRPKQRGPVVVPNIYSWNFYQTNKYLYLTIGGNSQPALWSRYIEDAYWIWRVPWENPTQVEKIRLPPSPLNLISKSIRSKN